MLTSLSFVCTFLPVPDFSAMKGQVRSQALRNVTYFRRCIFESGSSIAEWQFLLSFVIFKAHSKSIQSWSARMIIDSLRMRDSDLYLHNGEVRIEGRRIKTAAMQQCSNVASET